MSAKSSSKLEGAFVFKGSITMVTHADHITWFRVGYVQIWV